MKRLYFHCSLSVCLSVCLSVSEQNTSRMYAPFWTRFLLNGCLLHCSDPIEIGDLGSKVKITVTENVCQNDEKYSRLF